MDNFYDAVFKFARDQLGEIYEKQGGVLKEGDIPDIVEDVRDIINSPYKFKVFRCDVNFSDDDYKRLKRDLEIHFNVRMETGSVIQGEEQQKRDTLWFSEKKKKDDFDSFYWSRLKEFLKKDGLPVEVIRVLNEDTDAIMNQIGDPGQNGKFSIYGAVVGYVQSGKTTNYASLITKAVDAGYKFVVVIAGNTNMLRSQTQVRINQMFVGKGDDGGLVGVGLINPAQANEKQPFSLTTEGKDFNTADAKKNSQATNLENAGTSVLLVIKKNTHMLSSVIKWLKNHYKHKISKHAMLLIDDESDWGSINTKSDDDPTAINGEIRGLLELFEKSSYVAYTATPFANIFIDHTIEEERRIGVRDMSVPISKDLFPRDFIYALDIPTNYCGAQKIFTDDDPGRFLVDIQDHERAFPLKHKQDHYVLELPESLLEAVRVFCLNIVIRYLQGEENKCNSMLVNISRFSNMHKRVAGLIEEYVADLKQEIGVYAKLLNSLAQSDLIAQMKKTFDTKFQTEFSWESVSGTLSDVMDKVIIRDIHQRSIKRLDYRKDKHIIVVGGLSLSRGVTLEGLSVSYFIRHSIYYDTLMQMGRWFGYRKGYEYLCKIYMPREIQEHFMVITECMVELMYKFKEMAEERLTPLDFGLAVRQDPRNLLQVTARNKRRSAKSIVLSLDLNGQLIETVRFAQKDPKIHAQNLELLHGFVKSLDKGDRRGSHIVYENIDKNKVLEFIKGFKVVKMPMKKWIIKYLEKKDRTWDVVLYSGTGDSVPGLEISAERRAKVRETSGDCLEFKNRKLSSGDPERPLLSENIYQESRTKSRGERSSFLRRNLTRPVLMLHILDPEFTGFVFDCNGFLPAYGVCFPYEGVKSDSQTVAYLANAVLQQEIFQEIFESEGYNEEQENGDD